MTLLEESRGISSSIPQCRRLQMRHYISAGPDHMRHIDGYDKLNPYGFTVHGAIVHDGFSRKKNFFHSKHLHKINVKIYNHQVRINMGGKVKAKK